jgi:hypothetical protein
VSLHQQQTATLIQPERRVAASPLQLDTISRESEECAYPEEF